MSSLGDDRTGWVLFSFFLLSVSPVPGVRIGTAEGEIHRTSNWEPAAPSADLVARGRHELRSGCQDRPGQLVNETSRLMPWHDSCLPVRRWALWHSSLKGNSKKKARHGKIVSFFFFFFSFSRFLRRFPLRAMVTALFFFFPNRKEVNIYIYFLK